MPKNLYRRGAIWWGRVQVAGTEHRRSLRTRDRAEAGKRLKAWKTELERAAHFGIARHSWQEAVTRYVAEIMPHAVKASTATRYLSSFRTVDPILAGLHLDQIDRRTIAQDRRPQGPTNATRRRDLTAVSQVLRAAVSWEWIDRNVALRVRPQRDPRAPRPGTPPDRRGHHRADRRMSQRDAARAGAHPAVDRHAPGGDGIAGATPDRFRQEGDHAGAHQVGPRSHRADVGTGGRHTQGAARAPRMPVRVLARRGRALPQPEQSLAAIGKRAGVRFRRHDLRHRYAVDYLSDGGSIYDLQQILGHASIKTTEIYLAFLTPAEQRVAKRLGANADGT